MDADPKDDEQALLAVAPRNTEEELQQMDVEQGNEEQVKEQKNVVQGIEGKLMLSMVLLIVWSL
jgi:hypothetical protein